MSSPFEPVPPAAAPFRGYRWQLDRAVQTNTWSRLLFSTALLLYTVFGPGILLRFPSSGGGVGFEPVSRFYAFRPVLYALGFIAMVSVLAVLARRAVLLFELVLAADMTETTSPSERERYVRHLQPSTLPLLLSGSRLVDLLILLALEVGYAFWILLLVATIPPGLRVYGVVGVVIGSYGLFASIITCVSVWVSLNARLRRLQP